MNKQEFIKYFIQKYGKTHHLDSELFRDILLDFEEYLEDEKENLVKCQSR